MTLFNLKKMVNWNNCWKIVMHYKSHLRTFKSQNWCRLINWDDHWLARWWFWINSFSFSFNSTSSFPPFFKLRHSFSKINLLWRKRDSWSGYNLNKLLMIEISEKIKDWNEVKLLLSCLKINESILSRMNWRYEKPE